ncbi:phosphopantetheine adenylyltransferase [Spiroplasma tabanidicola]|uniref:Phosphopantetheine adenylyltransferase n=2 Tax=Spiroplasma tabanidicola TaxID=324079 RepID=A0A6I6CDD5_9MOLU|nr:pantetheine-phosphate adenylyltransferase [Spiroplasma tabanidicola]QGS52328.1 phosphopantetheine adenylyltransferase [Spiroplasma tabanidicola]
MIAIYPGSFNPFHQGHLDILNKAVKLFSKVYIVITKNIAKELEPNLASRVIQVKNFTKEVKNCEVLINQDELTADFAKKLNASYIIRGVRNEADFSYEREIYDVNKYLNPKLETIILIADSEKREISSTSIKEIELYKRGKK